jgi:histidinol-phosphate aminotransferase
MQEDTLAASQVAGRRALERLVRASADPSPASWIRLNTNESTFAPSAHVVAAMAAAARTVNRYPDPSGEPLRTRLAVHHGVSAGNILVSHGADGVLGACFRAFCDPGSPVILADPTYPFLYNLAELAGATIVRASSPGMLFAASRTANCGMTILVNPSNPSGAWWPPDKVTMEAPRSGVFVVDEAYADFAPDSLSSRATSHQNWIVVRTFSKAYGLAGVRLGYAIGNEELIGRLSSAQDPYPVSTLAIAAGLAALDDEAHYLRNVASVRTERSRLTDALRESGWTVDESSANFIFAKPPPPGEVSKYLETLRLRHVHVRTFANAPDGIRISVGQPDENDAFLRAIDAAWS